MKSSSGGRLTRSEAEAQGFTVDDRTYPHFRYKGPRFAPTETVEVYPDLEARLLEARGAIMRRAELSWLGSRDPEDHAEIRRRHARARRELERAVLGATTGRS